MEPLFREAGPGMLGQGQAYPEVVEVRAPLGPGDRVVVLSESAVRATGADLLQLVHDPPPQLAAGRVADAARRRGQHDPIGVHVLEVQSGHARPVGSPHPAIARIARERPRTVDSDGTLIGGSARAARAERLDRLGAPPARVSWLAVFFVAALAGVAVALATRGGDTPRPATRAPDITVTSVMIEADTHEADEGVPEVEPAEAPPEAPEVTALFEADTKERLAKNIRNHVTKTFPSDGDAVFTRLEAAVLARRKDPMVVQALVELLKEPELKRTTRWVQELLPRLVADEGPADPGATAPDGEARAEP